MICSQQFKQSTDMSHPESQFRSPLRVGSKSSCKPSKSVGKFSKYKQQSESKSQAARVKEISDRQPYKNILNRLLRSENLAKFVKEAEKYVELNEEMVLSFRSNNPEHEESRREFHEYGRALLKDGSFIRYYCKLVEKEFHEDRKKMREFFFEKYRSQICLREKMFFDYFKEEMPIHHNEDSITFSYTMSKPKDKNDIPKPNQRSKSHKKARTQVSFGAKENHNQKELETLSEDEKIESSNPVQTKSICSESNIPKSQAKKSKIVHFQKEAVEEVTQEETYRSPYIKYNPKETEEEREFRLSGLAKPNSSKKKEKRNTAKFSDQIKSNPKLREIYEQLVKEKEERDKIIKSNNKVKESSQKPVVRSSATYFPSESFLSIKLRELTNQDRERLTIIQQEILVNYPTIHLKAHQRGIQVSAQRVEGHYKRHIIKKAILTDIHHYLEPDYIGIVVEPADANIQDIPPCEFEPDERLEVVLFL